jgi:hypothetical protein
MRALRDTPQIVEKVRSGALPVTAVVKVQQFLRREKARRGRPVAMEARVELFERVQGKSTREIERELMRISPEAALPRERERVLDDSHSELRLVIPEALREKLELLKSLHSHRMKDPNSTVELLELMATEALKETQPVQQGSGAGEEADQSVAPISLKADQNRSIPWRVRRLVRTRDQGRCTYRDLRTGRICGSTRFLQIDHRIPLSSGGSSRDLGNLRLVCGQHNRFLWDRWKASAG